MKKKDELLERFVAMRISGKTFDEISRELEVSKQTLINWSKDEDAKDVISFGKLMRIQSTLKAFELDREARIQRLAILAQKINKELSNREFIDFETAKLLTLAVMIEKKLNDALPIVKFDNENQSFEWGVDKSSFTFNPND